MHCSILAPAFTLGQSSPQSLKQLCADNLGTEDIRLFALVPVSEAPHAQQIAIQILDSQFSISSVEELLAQKEQLATQLQRSQEALSSCTEKLKSLTEGVETTKQSKLEEDNRKLRQLLK